MTELGALLKDGGVAAALIVVVLAFLKYLKSERETSAKEHEQVITVMTNHLEHTVNTQAASANMMTSALNGIAEVVKKFCDEKGR